MLPSRLMIVNLVLVYINVARGVLDEIFHKACRGQCGQGEGDCDKDRDCLPGLICDYDWWFNKDYCKAGPNTKNYNWSEWGEWSECSEVCGEIGIKSRARDCIPPKNGGFPCPSSVDEELATCFPGHCHVDGGWGEWGDWDSCSLSCGEGVQSRYRNCDSPAPFAGADNIWHDCERDGSSDTETRTCNENPCPTTTPKPSDCNDKDFNFCISYVRIYGERYCGENWFVGDNGRYGCKKSCNLC